MPRILVALSAALLAAGCAQESAVPAGAALVRSGPPANAGAAQQVPANGSPLLAARAGHVTKVPASPKDDAPPAPPAKLFSLVKYDAPVGKCNAYVTPDPGDGQKHPAIVWITGGNCNAIDEGSWTVGKPDNDQSASAFRQAGMVMMFPGLRGGNDNPGKKEGFYGEVDDVLAATDTLVKLPYVDSKRVYLGGHSTGGTLALLVAEASDRYRAVFSFGPVGDVTGYGGQFVYRRPARRRGDAPALADPLARGGEDADVRHRRRARRQPRLAAEHGQGVQEPAARVPPRQVRHALQRAAAGDETDRGEDRQGRRRRGRHTDRGRSERGDGAKGR